MNEYNSQYSFWMFI